MIFFVIVFATNFNVIDLTEDELDIIVFDEKNNINSAPLDDCQNTNQTLNLEVDISSTINSATKEKKDDFNHKNNNNSDSLPQNRYNNEDPEITPDDKEFRKNIEEALENPYVLNFVKQYEHDFISNDDDFEVQKVIISNDKLDQEQPGGYNEIINNTSLERHINNYSKASDNLSPTSSEIKNKNEIKEITCITSIKPLEYPEKGGITTNCHYDTNDKKSMLNRYIVFDDMELTKIPDLIIYKECLESLSMKNNIISFIPENIMELKFLRQLDLSHNKINKFYCKIENMELDWLDLSYNWLAYSTCKPIFLMTTLKYLNLQNNDICFMERFNSMKLISLNISNNPIFEISDCFYKLSNITQLYISNLKVSNRVYFNKVLPNLKVLDISHNKSTHHIYNIVILSALEEVNLSNCKLKNLSILSKMLTLKKLILSKNNIRVFPIDFLSLRGNLKMLDIRENPLEIIATRKYIGALGFLEHFYGNVLLDDSIIKASRELSFDEISSLKYKREAVYFKKLQKNKSNDRFNIDIIGEALGRNDEETRKEVEWVMSLMEEMRDSGFTSLEKTLKETMEIIKCNRSKIIRVKSVINHLNTKFSSKFYKFLEAILSKYKFECLNSAVIYIYNSDEHLNYWMYHLRDILSFTGIEKIEVNSQIHNDKNIILWSFINMINSEELVRIVKLELEKDEEMIKILHTLLGNIQGRCRKRLIEGTLKQTVLSQEDSIKYILKKYQMIDQSL